MRLKISSVALATLLTASCAAQQGAPKSTLGSNNAMERQIEKTKDVSVNSEVAEDFAPPLRCDSNGNVYMLSEEYGSSAVLKISRDGSKVTHFRHVDPAIRVTVAQRYAVALDGHVYQVVGVEGSFANYAFKFDKEGEYQSTVKFDPRLPWQLHTLAQFANGNFLVMGLEYDKEQGSPMWPFTAVFGPDGTMIREISFDQDEKLHELAASRDSRTVSVARPLSNRAVISARAEPAPDGNIYVMRSISPATIYVVSPAGEIVRSFTVKQSDESYRPFALQIAENRIAIMYFQPQTPNMFIQVLDLEGHPIVRYKPVPVKGKDYNIFGLGFACYSANPDRFTFITSNDKNRLVLREAEAVH